MQPGVEGERLLKFQAIETCGLERVENQVPAMSRYRARNRHEAIAMKKIVAEVLGSRSEPPVAANWGLARRRVRRRRDTRKQACGCRSDLAPLLRGGTGAHVAVQTRGRPCPHSPRMIATRAKNRGIAQPGSAEVLGTSGRRFKSCCPDQIFAMPRRPRQRAARDAGPRRGPLSGSSGRFG